MPNKSAFVLAIDFGLTNMGVAVGQKITNTASELTTLKAKNGDPNWIEVRGLVAKYSPMLLLVGYPLNIDGTESVMSKRVQKFANRLERETNIKTVLIDERLSTREAKVLSKKYNFKKRRFKIHDHGSSFLSIISLRPWIRMVTFIAPCLWSLPRSLTIVLMDL